MHHLMEAVIILHTEPTRMVPMALAEALAGASAGALAEDSAEALAGASAEEDGGDKPENPALKAALEHQESKAAEVKRGCEAQRGFMPHERFSGMGRCRGFGKA
jgi:hypothetical protein